ncbi:uncharacterized protein I206_102082 [Kwoniella pini CBS 10737]|uniref:BHLH domain-containing protein n=1 Tax=Kwoniella pini CBS 10737 TaxID=1296096 RepID=A0A1B9HUV6_9TREE|nr:uncharacterized protein I206_06825 [Kwoniella pini CBS 10737]OCF47051.1 hypothetical protein I206_06825 [Kwoniella pini CBS 10737]
MTTIKTEGFKVPGVDNGSNRPSMHRPFSDGSMTVETNLLTSLMSGSPHQMSMNMVSPYSFSSSLPAQTHTFDYSMNSPLSTSADRFHPAAIFNAIKFGVDNPEPPINFGNEDNQSQDERSRSQSSSRSSHIGKAPSSRSRTARKSMNDVRPPSGSIQPRGRTNVTGRAQSFSGAAQMGITNTIHEIKPMGLGIGLDTHVEGEQTDSISPPDFGLSGNFGMSIPHNENDNVSWGSGSVPSMVPGSLGSFGETVDDAVIDSPMTPAKPLHLLSDESYKKQRRRECHNQVEKRRREHINAKIEELSQLLPPAYNLPNDEEAIEDDDEEEGKPQLTAGGKKKKTKRTGSTTTKAALKDAVQCKGRILSQSVQYIRDLKHLTDLQSGRIAHLENMLLTYGVNTTFQPTPMANPQSSLFWMNDNNLPNTLNQQPTFDLSGAHNLEAMRPSPELERQFSFDHMNLDARNWGNSMMNGNGQTHELAHDILMSFEPSPQNTTSSTSANNIRRSSESVSSSASFDRDNTEALELQSPLSMNMSISDMRGRQRERTVRKDSQAELQMSMSALLSQGRDESDGGMRW